MSSEYSSNHTPITGDFGEHLVLYWLSKNGYETAHVQLVGIDIIASKNGKRMGISVKSRSRKEGDSDFGLTINSPIKTIEKVTQTCSHFGCEEYFAFVIDQMGTITVVITPLTVILEHYKISPKSSQDWNTQKFRKDSRSMVFEIDWK